MFTQTLIHVGILVYFSVSSGHGIDFDWHTGTKAAATVEEKVVLVDQYDFLFHRRGGLRAGMPVKIDSMSGRNGKVHQNSYMNQSLREHASLLTILFPSLELSAIRNCFVFRIGT